MKFKGSEIPVIPGQFKAPLIAAAVHVTCGIVANEIVEDRDGTPATTQQVSVSTDHTAIWLGTIYAASVEGMDIDELSKSRHLPELFGERFSARLDGYSRQQTFYCFIQNKDPRRLVSAT